MPFTNGFVGLENYQVLLADERFWTSLLVSLVYTGSTVVAAGRRLGWRSPCWSWT